MTLRKFEKLDVTNPEIKRLQYRLEETFQPITDSPVLGGRLIDDIDLASGTTSKIAHKLERKLVGWIVIGKNAAQHVYDANSGKTDLDQYIHLTASGTTTVTVWVF
tara:strand:+ start:900 stop:1217 length:318 start_codon:yes stop_codon:yes gene_type:complete